MYLAFSELKPLWDASQSSMAIKTLEDCSVLTYPWLTDDNEIELRTLIQSQDEDVSIVIIFNMHSNQIQFAHFDNWGDFSKKSIDEFKSRFTQLNLKDYAEASFASLSPVPNITSSKADFSQPIQWIASFRYSKNERVRNIFETIIAKRKELIGIVNGRDKQEQKQDIGANYRKFAELRAKEISTNMKHRWRSLEFDNENPLQVELVKRFYSGSDTLLIGETGIGKTWNPLNIAKVNGISTKMIQFVQNTDSVDLHGVDVIRQGLFDKEPSMYFRYGQMSMAFIEARDQAKLGEPTMLILDELLRARDQSSLISSLSVSELTDEYVLTLPNVVDYVMLKNHDTNAVSWFAVTEQVDERMTWISIKDGAIAGAKPKEIFFTTDLALASEMHSRGDLPTIRKDYLKNIQNSILATGQKNEEIRVPQRAISIIATSNVGEHYDVGMSMDNALFRRLRKLPVQSPPIPFMVNRCLQNVEFKNDEIKKRSEKIITKFLKTLSERLGKEIDSTARVNFGTVNDIIESIDLDDPFKNTGFGNIFDALKSKAYDFVDLDSDSTAEDLIASNVITQIHEMVEVIQMSLDNKESLVNMNASSSAQRTPSGTSRGGGSRRSRGAF